MNRKRDHMIRLPFGRRRACRNAALMLSMAALAACAPMHVPQNSSVGLYDPEKTAKTAQTPRGKLTYLNKLCPPPGTAKFLMPDVTTKFPRRRMPAMRYSAGDRFNLMVLHSEEFTGNYAINVDGTIILPFAGAIRAEGLTNKQLSQRIRSTLIRRGLFTERGAQISVHPVQYAPVNVTVAGAVFTPGRHTINIVKEQNRLDQRKVKTGDSPLDRFLPAAIMAAGGVRPDADLTNVRVFRNGKSYRLNWRGVIRGYPVDDMPLIQGDHVEIGEAGCFQSALVRPSQITPAGIRIFLSNLTRPALSNAGSAANPIGHLGVPYGTRLLQGLVQANCVGGIYATNARRIAVLISRNPKTGKTEVIQRSIEDLVRRADRDAINPYLMPNDAIACYDSGVTEFRDVMSTIYETILPAAGFKRF